MTGFYVYGHTLADFSARLWIGAYDRDGSLEQAVQVEPGVPADSAIWASDTDGAGNLVVLAKLVEAPGDAPVPVLARFEPDGSESWRRADVRVWEAADRLSDDRGTLAAFDGVDGEPLWTAVPIADTGAYQFQWGGALELGGDGTLYSSVNVELNSGTRSFVAAYAGGGSELSWSVSTDEFDWADGYDFTVRAIAADGVGGAALVGQFTRGGEPYKDGVGTFVVELDGAGAPGCMSQRNGKGGRVSWRGRRAG